jgi:ribonuclease PH
VCCRSTACRLGILTRADGSAEWEQEQTVVLAAVHGPIVAGGWRESPTEATVEVHFKPFNGKSGEPPPKCAKE